MKYSMQTLITKNNEETHINSILIELTTDEAIINSILDNPEVYQMVNGTKYTKPLQESYREELASKGFKFLRIVAENATVGLFSFREITKVLIEGHIHMLPESHKKGYGKQALNKAFKYFSRSESYKKVMTYVPSNCFHVLKFMQDNDFQACGSIPEAIIYNNKLVNLFVFERGL